MMDALNVAQENGLVVLSVNVAVRCLTCGREWFVRLLPSQARGNSLPEKLFVCYACRREDGQPRSGV